MSEDNRGVKILTDWSFRFYNDNHVLASMNSLKDFENQDIMEVYNELFKYFEK